MYSAITFHEESEHSLPITILFQSFQGATGHVNQAMAWLGDYDTGTTNTHSHDQLGVGPRVSSDCLNLLRSNKRRQNESFHDDGIIELV